MTSGTILRIDASARRSASVSRDLTTRIIAGLPEQNVITRDVAIDPLPIIDETWVGATFTAPEDRTDDQHAALELSDVLVTELITANTIVIGLPVYNFGVPTALKAWVDLVARAGVTFRYTENGPQGLLTGKKVVVAYASGGTPLGADFDFASTYLRQVLGFLGISDVQFVTSEILEDAA